MISVPGHSDMAPGASFHIEYEHIQMHKVAGTVGP